MASRGIAKTPLPGGGALGDIVILRDRRLYLSPDGFLFQWDGRGWHRLVYDTKAGAMHRSGIRRQRQAYVGHPALAGKTRGS